MSPSFPLPFQNNSIIKEARGKRQEARSKRQEARENRKSKIVKSKIILRYAREGYDLMRLRLASRRRKMKRRMVKPHSEEPP